MRQLANAPKFKRSMLGGSRTSNSREEHANGRDERGGMREERENRERREVNREQKQRQTREPTGFQRDEPSTLAVEGEGDEGSGTRRGKGREEKRKEGGVLT